MVRSKIEVWMRRQLFIQRDEGRCVKLVLKHNQVGNKLGNEVMTIRVPAKADEDFMIGAIGEIESSAEADAGGIGGTQSYVVLSFFEDSDKPLARFTFRVQGDDDEDESDVTSEPPNRVGITSQLMRHNEAIMRNSTVATGQVVSVMQRTIARQQEMIEKLTEQRMETFHLIEELQSQKHERDLATSREAMKQGMMRDVFEKVSLLAPVVINRLGGKKLLPEKKTAQEMVLKEFMNSLTPDQMEMMSRVLNKDQLMVVLSMAEQFAKEDKEAEEKRAPTKLEPVG